MPTEEFSDIIDQNALRWSHRFQGSGEQTVCIRYSPVFIFRSAIDNTLCQCPYDDDEDGKLKHGQQMAVYLPGRPDPNGSGVAVGS